MANIFIATRGLPSLLYPSVELGRRLAAAGHAVTIAGDEPVRALADQHGLRFALLQPDRHDAFLETDAASSLPARLRQRRRRQAQAIASLGVDGFADALRAAHTDLALVNGEMHAHVIAAAAEVPVALLNTFLSIWRRPGLPPPHHAAIPGHGWRGTPAGMSALWLNLRARRWRRRWTERWRHAGCDRVSTLHRLATRRGFDLAREMDSGQWLMPFTFRSLPVLSLHALEFEFPHVPAPHVAYVGPMILASRAGDPPLAEDQARLARLLDHRRRNGGQARLIYAAFGSVLSTDLTFLRRLMSIAEARPSWTLIVSLSGRVAPADLGPVPERVHLFPWLPQLDVLAAADVAVTHGGINSVDECVTRGVPMLVYCGGETDMAGTTSRVVHHGLGIAGHRGADSMAAIRGHLDRLLNEPTFRERVAAMRGRYAAYVDQHVAERTVDRLLERARHAGAPAAAAVSGPR